jgi:hypothetical protein
LILWGILIAIAVFAVSFFKKGFIKTAQNSAILVLDSRDFYAYGYESYLVGITKGKTKAYYTLSKKTPFYAVPLKPKAVGRDEPKETLPAKQVIRMGAVFRDGGDAWAPAEYYKEEKLMRGFVLLPRSWESAVKAYSIEEREKLAHERYVAYVKKNFELIVFKNRKDVTKELADSLQAYLLDDFHDKKAMYAALNTDKAGIEAAKRWYLDPINIDIDVLQLDPKYKRPALGADANKKKEQ